MRISHLSCLVLPFLVACSSYSPPANVAGIPRDELIARMGQPDKVSQRATGSRLEFPRGPMGHHTWFVYLDASGHATRAEQVLTESNFNQIAPGMTQDEVGERLGRPSDVQGLGRSRGVVWSYRYENPFCQWFRVEIALDRRVRSAGYGQPPECSRPAKIIFP